MKRNFINLISLILLYACSSVAVTGRKQLNLVPNNEIISMSNLQYQKVLSENSLSSDKEKTELVKRVGMRIQKAVENYMASTGNASALKDFNWEFNLIQDDKTVNAWCMPGGKVAFYTAILPVCANEEGIAVVMGHEVAHAIANHGAERMSEQLIAQLGLQAFSTAMGQNPSMTQQIFLQAIGMGTNLGLLKFSRKHESEADHMGLIFMAMAGYNPTSAPKFWARMTEMSKGPQPPEFVSTHPSHETRIKDLESWMPEALGYYKK